MKFIRSHKQLPEEKDHRGGRSEWAAVVTESPSIQEWPPGSSFLQSLLCPRYPLCVVPGNLPVWVPDFSVAPGLVFLTPCLWWHRFRVPWAGLQSGLLSLRRPLPHWDPVFALPLLLPLPTCLPNLLTQHRLNSQAVHILREDHGKSGSRSPPHLTSPLPPLLGPHMSPADWNTQNFVRWITVISTFLIQLYVYLQAQSSHFQHDVIRVLFQS